MPIFRTAVRFLQMVEEHDKLPDLLFIKKRQIVLADRPVEKASGQIRFMAGKRLKKELLQIYGNPFIMLFIHQLHPMVLLRLYYKNISPHQRIAVFFNIIVDLSIQEKVYFAPVVPMVIRMDCQI